jgi:transposase
LVASPEMTNPTSIAAGGRRSRRSWSDEEKRRIVAEAVLPGASVADIARRHGVNANLVFNWRKTARAALLAAAPNASAVALQENASSLAAEHCEFIPIGVIGRAEDEAPALIDGPSSTVAGDASSRRESLPRPGMDERPGVIEIDLADGVRLRVDAFVNERALRRVLTVLKVMP